MDSKSSEVKSLTWKAMESLNAQTTENCVRAIYETKEAKKEGEVYNFTVTTYLTRLPKTALDYKTLTLEQCEVAEDAFDVEEYQVTLDGSSNAYSFTKVKGTKTTPEDFVRSLLFADD